MTQKHPELSKAEWLIMKVCWQHKKCTARDVYEQVTRHKKWEYQTVKTMLDRLVTKTYLAREKFGPVCIYKPLVSRSKVVGRAVETFVDTVLDNTFAPILSYFVQGKKLDEEELARLKQLIDAYEDDDEHA